MKLHELKIKGKYMVAIDNGSKLFELRKNDRDYQVGDLIKFNVVPSDGETVDSDYFVYVEETPTCQKICKYVYLNDLYKITYVLKDVPQYGLDVEYCILGIKKLEIKEI